MRKPFKAVASIAIAAIFLSANPAAAQNSNPAYNSTLYYDLAHQNYMGQISWVGCDRWNMPLYQLTGGTYQATHYSVDELVGYCVDGDMVYP